jgi:hypothetical protein
MRINSERSADAAGTVELEAGAEDIGDAAAMAVADAIDTVANVALATGDMPTPESNDADSESPQAASTVSPDGTLGALGELAARRAALQAAAAAVVSSTARRATETGRPLVQRVIRHTPHDAELEAQRAARRRRRHAAIVAVLAAALGMAVGLYQKSRSSRAGQSEAPIDDTMPVSVVETAAIVSVDGDGSAAVDEITLPDEQVTNSESDQRLA